MKNIKLTWLIILTVLCAIIIWNIPESAYADILTNKEIRKEGYHIKGFPSSVKTFKYINSYDIHGAYMDIFPTKAGFLMPGNGDVTMYDWKNGRKIWQATVDNTKGWGYEAFSGGDNLSLAISESGIYFAASSVQPDGVRVRLWRNGKLVGNCLALPSQGNKLKPSYYHLAITEKGRIFMSYYLIDLRDDANIYDDPKPINKILVIDNGKVIARAESFNEILPGAVLATGNNKTLYRVSLKPGIVYFKTIARKIPNFAQFPSNYLLAENGAVYNQSGRIIKPNSQHKINPHDFNFMNNGWTTDWQAFRINKKMYEICNISNNKSWLYKYMPRQDVVSVSADGKYLLSHEYSIESDNIDTIRLYERPNILRAALRYDIEKMVSFGANRMVGEDCNNWILSPDGKSVILKYQYMGIGGTAMLYRW